MAQKKSPARKPAAKKKAPVRKRAGAKKKSTASSSTNYTTLVALVVILVIIAVASLYTIREAQTADTPSPQVAQKSAPAKRNEPTGTSSVPPTKEEEETVEVESINRNTALPENDDPEAYYYTSSFDFAWPAYDVDDQIVEHLAYTLSYDEKREQPEWVAYKLTAAQLSGERVSRTDNFKEDPLVTTGSASLSDYKSTGYDRGHLAPAADFAWSLESMKESFYMSNMSPQTPGFNRGIWKVLEEQVRDWAMEHKELYIVVGPIYRGKVATVGKNKVAIPTAYYKAILDISPPGIKAIGFIMPNAKSNEDLETFVVSLDEIEKQANLDLFPILPDDLEKQLEAKSEFNKWD
ncbi:MAG: DNA/RNA non-specific endonuclease [Cyclobacteriaceae bacterium]